jgi:hypothetical protein
MKSVGLTQSYQIRQLTTKLLLELAEQPVEGLKEQCARAVALKNLSNVREDSENRIRIHRGKPSPGSLRPRAAPVKARNGRLALISTAELIGEAESVSVSTIGGDAVPARPV